MTTYAPTIFVYLILVYGTVAAMAVTVAGMLIAFDQLRTQPSFDVGRFLPAVLAIAITAAIAGGILGVTRWAILVWG